MDSIEAIGLRYDIEVTSTSREQTVLAEPRAAPFSKSMLFVAARRTAMFGGQMISKLIHSFAVAASLIWSCGSVLASDQPVESSPKKAIRLTFGGIEYLHRWSQNGQHEFTPQGQEDLARWQDMVTINVHETVINADQLAGVANKVLANYQRVGKIVRTSSLPRTAQRPAEHLAVAILGNRQFSEAAFARFVLIDGIGFVVVCSHRAYGEGAATKIGKWVQKTGPSTEKTLMAWNGVPALKSLKQLPQSK